VDQAAMIGGLQSGLVVRTIYIGSRRSSIRLDLSTWTAVHEVALREGITRSQLFARIFSRQPKELSFTVALRQYLLRYFRDAATEDGHAEAGHGAISFTLPEAERAA
jgi:predicted DNA-binding ribbon-helix-helix protein